MGAIDSETRGKKMNILLVALNSKYSHTNLAVRYLKDLRMLQYPCWNSPLIRVMTIYCGKFLSSNRKLFAFHVTYGILKES